MLKKLLKDTKFQYTIKEFFNNNKKDILDIILFGSSVKGKEKPEDIDLLILFKDKKEIDVSYELKKMLEKNGFNVEIVDKTYKELFEESFKVRESILSEGYSLVYNRFLSEGLGYTKFILFKYKLEGFSKSDRMRFYYSLYGRSKDQRGILKEMGSIKFSETILLCLVEKSLEMEEYLNSWKIKFTEFPIMIPIRVSSVLKK